MARGLNGEQNQARTLTHSLRLLETSPVVQQHINPKGSALLNNIAQPDSKIQFTQQSTSQNLPNSQSLKMQFTTLISAFVFAATALAAPAPVVDSSTKAQAGATTWEFHPFLDASCQTPTSNTLGGSQAPGSQCINVTQRYGDKVYSAATTQGCKDTFPPPTKTDLR